MNTSILGNNLERERQKVFFRRFGNVYLHREYLERKADRDFVTSLEKKIQSRHGSFVASASQFSWLGDVEQRLKGDPDMSRLTGKLVDDARGILRNDALPSGRMLILMDLLDKAAGGKLSKKDLGMLQFLVLEGTTDPVGED